MKVISYMKSVPWQTARVENYSKPELLSLGLFIEYLRTGLHCTEGVNGTK